MEQMTVRDDFDFFDIADDFVRQPIIILDDELLDEIFSDEVKDEICDSSMEYVSEIVEDENSNQQSLSFYQEYMSSLGSFVEHYENIQLQYPGVYSKIKDSNERIEKLMRLAIRDCPTDLLGKMIAANVYDKTYCFNRFLDNWYFSDSFGKNGKKDRKLSDTMFDVGTKFSQLLHFAEDTLAERQRLERIRTREHIKIRG